MKEKIRQAVEKQSREHEHIFLKAAHFDRSLLENRYSDIYVMIRSLTSLMELDLMKHFDQEEQLFYPAALLGVPDYEMTQLVLALQKDHGMLIREFELIRDEAVRMQEGHALDEKLVQRFKEFLAHLQNHARWEADIFFPKLDKSAEAHAAMEAILRRGAV